MSELLITEEKRSDISTVYAYLVVTEVTEFGQDKHSDRFSCFNGDYQVTKEREFIAELNAKNPGRYHSYCIMWDSCN
jgi:hypothetical protein